MTYSVVVNDNICSIILTEPDGQRTICLDVAEDHADRIARLLNLTKGSETKQSVFEACREEVELQLCKAHYEEVQADNPEILEMLETTLDRGIPLTVLKGWIEGMRQPEELTFKFYCAARWYEASKK